MNPCCVMVRTVDELAGPLSSETTSFLLRPSAEYPSASSNPHCQQEKVISVLLWLICRILRCIHKRLQALSRAGQPCSCSVDLLGIYLHQCTKPSNAFCWLRAVTSWLVDSIIFSQSCCAPSLPTDMALRHRIFKGQFPSPTVPWTDLCQGDESF